MLRIRQSVPAAGEWSDEAHSQVRRITAQRLLESKTSVPHYYVTVDVRMDKLLALRAQLNKALEKDGAKLSVNDLIVKASALVGAVHKAVQSSLTITGHVQDLCAVMNRSRRGSSHLEGAKNIVSSALFLLHISHTVVCTVCTHMLR